MLTERKSQVTGRTSAHPGAQESTARHAQSESPLDLCLQIARPRQRSQADQRSRFI
jgi:hypothetical protein